MAGVVVRYVVYSNGETLVLTSFLKSHPRMYFIPHYKEVISN